MSPTDPVLTYVLDKLAAMETRPEMWAGTREGFILTLVTMVELLLHKAPPAPSGISMTSELMHRLCGPGNQLVDARGDIDKPWAKKCVGITRMFIEEHHAHVG